MGEEGVGRDVYLLSPPRPELAYVERPEGTCSHWLRPESLVDRLSVSKLGTWEQERVNCSPKTTHHVVT